MKNKLFFFSLLLCGLIFAGSGSVYAETGSQTHQEVVCDDVLAVGEFITVTGDGEVITDLTTITVLNSSVDLDNNSVSLELSSSELVDVVSVYIDSGVLGNVSVGDVVVSGDLEMEFDMLEVVLEGNDTAYYVEELENNTHLVLSIEFDGESREVVVMGGSGFFGWLSGDVGGSGVPVWVVLVVLAVEGYMYLNRDG
ncbi:hypothetical protein [Methanonatronarchaeum sp. AMET-Sl]|uniref:hypothetical protein n=1 Tax=Methanonatronarchaeum sp. AMET-Sl TaxID=3037654 RepID=UPI00244E3B27|nr:hypothetical protein [Methanonatronarchaeum sp. AMET-Sl]WGI17872.1 hypothetical protein QEN48_02380 [Methanonatronarchaeum sp. AMET-Sl]